MKSPLRFCPRLGQGTAAGRSRARANYQLESCRRFHRDNHFELISCEHGSCTLLLLAGLFSAAVAWILAISRTFTTEEPVNMLAEASDRSTSGKSARRRRDRLIFRDYVENGHKFLRFLASCRTLCSVLAVNTDCHLSFAYADQSGLVPLFGLSARPT